MITMLESLSLLTSTFASILHQNTKVITGIIFHSTNSSLAEIQENILNFCNLLSLKLSAESQF